MSPKSLFTIIHQNLTLRSLALLTFSPYSVQTNKNSNFFFHSFCMKRFDDREPFWKKKNSTNLYEDKLVTLTVPTHCGLIALPPFWTRWATGTIVPLHFVAISASPVSSITLFSTWPMAGHFWRQMAFLLFYNVWTLRQKLKLVFSVSK